MSLIEEALRKQREESEQAPSGSNPLKLAGVPAAPPSLPEPDAPAEEPVAQRRSWTLLAAIGGIGLLLVIAIIWLLFFGMKLWQTPNAPLPRPSAAPIGHHAPAPTGTSAVAVAVTTHRTTLTAPLATNSARLVPPAEVPSAPAPPTPPTAPLLLSPVAVQTGTAPVHVTAPVEGTALFATVPAPPPVKEAPLVRIGGTTTNFVTRPEATIWPKLTVSGFISTARGPHGAAIVSGQMVGPGDTIEGVKVIAVDKRGVQFGFGGETQTLAVGGTTE